MSDEIKLALKEARNLVKGAKYIEAIKKCKSILKKDRSNYSALVLLGAAMMEVDEYKVQTPLVLRKAVDLQPGNPLAWQALMTYFEKTSPAGDDSSELAAIYCKIMQLDLDFEKFSKLLNKIVDLLFRSKDNALSLQVVGNLMKFRDDLAEEKKRLMDKVVAPVLIDYPNLENEYTEFLLTVLASVVKDAEIANRRDYFLKYLNLLYRTSQFTALRDEAKEMHRLYPEDVRPLEWICRIQYERYIFCDTHEDISGFFNALLELEADSMDGLIARSMYLMDKGNYIESRDCLKNIVSRGKTSVHVWFALTEVASRLYCWEEAEYAAERALAFGSTVPCQLKRRLETTLIKCLANSKCETKWKSVVSMCTKMLADEPTNDKLRILRARAYTLLNQPEVLDELTVMESREESKADGTVLRALYLANRGLLAEAAKVLTDSAIDTSAAWLLLGKVYWEMAEFPDSLRALLNAARVDRNNWECFVRLGRYYAEQGDDPIRSKRCYQMALRINPSSEEASIGLCTTYRLLNDTEANLQLLLGITAQENAPKWAWLRLGLQYLDREEPAKAIRALQCAIRADPNDNHSWESLADAYWARGAYTSALRSYERALQLSPGSTYPAIQLANIKLIIGQHEEAVNDFERILHEAEGRYVPALKGLAEARLSLAKENIRRHFLGRARENVQDAVDNLTIAIIERADISCLWKFLADAFYMVATMPDRYCRLDVMPAFAGNETTTSGTKHVLVGRQELFSLSSRCYSRALSISRDSALLWHNLACSYFARSDYCHTYDECDNSREVVGKALAAAKQAVTLSRSSWLHWNLLGIICMSSQVGNYALAQHCFVMAIDIEPNNAPSWSNLGTLYLRLGELYKANEAFSRAQRADPAYMNSWVGQALIAEKMRNKEAMDLFRHSLELGYHDQAALGYTHWVLTVLLDPSSKIDPLYTYIVEKMHAVQVATDALHWYNNERQRDNCCALNAHGLLLERSRLYESAAILFEEALRTCETVHRDGVRVNLARTYVAAQSQSEKAVELCRAVNEATFNSQCQLALSLFAADRYEESYSAYETALHWLAKDGTEKASILCAMAAIAHIFQGAEDAKTLLFQCLQIQPPLIAGFLAAAALGILHGDPQLATLVFDELKPFEGHPQHRRHIATLSAYFRLLQNDTVGSIRHLSKAIHRYPDDAGCWAGLVRLLAKTDAALVLPPCVEKTLFLSRKTTAGATSVVQIACASITSHTRDISTKFGLYPAQKTVFSFPADCESWANFIAVLPTGKLVRQDSRTNAQWLSKLITIVLDKQPITRNLREWLMLRRKMLSSHVDQ